MRKAVASATAAVTVNADLSAVNNKKDMKEVPNRELLSVSDFGYTIIIVIA